MSYSRDAPRKIYIGNLPPDIRTKDVEDLFTKFGRITFVDLKNRKGPPFAFLEYEDSRDAEDAVDERDGYDYDGYKLRVEFPREKRGFGGDRGGGRGGFGGGRGRGGGGGGGGYRGPKYRVIISGLPASGSWQDVKDHMREAGDIAFVNVYKDGSADCDFYNRDDMEYAVRKLDDSKFTSHERETAYIRVREESGGGRRSRSRSPYHR